MNILFISHLGDSPSMGPNWSVPAKVKAQMNYDNVLWINTTKAVLDRYVETGVFHPVSDFGKLNLDNFPSDFLRPDIVLFETFYSVSEALFAKQLFKHSIPYVITPRGSLTIKARHNSSRIKKDIAHFFLFDSFIKNAQAIQFLTEQEKKDSIGPYKNSFIIPNGISKKQKTKETFSGKAIKGVFIGRIDCYHKGLDLLLKAIVSIRQILREKNFTLDLYGPINKDALEIIELIRKENIGDIVSMKGEISGLDKESALLNADLFVLTSRFEGHPMGLIEALSYGIPCLVTPGTNMSEEIKKNNAGWVCQCDTDSIIDTLKQIVQSNKCIYSDKSNNALSLSQIYDWDLLANRLHQQLSFILNK